MAAENYHLKWDSHLSYLNSSVATLYKNEKFADVVLYSSSSSCGNGNGAEAGIPTVGVSAHKFILSSCSQFFATMFETAPISSPNGVLYIVLPPDLSHRAIQILVQYMYSGEATVANDILSEVLRGGEILKIRGLCRTSSTSSTTHNPQPRGEPLMTNGGTHYIQSAVNRPPPLPPIAHPHIPSAHVGDMYGVSKCPPGGSGSCGTRYTVEQSQTQQSQPQQQPPAPQQTQQTHAQQLQQTHQQFRGLGASVLPKDSPVIVKSPKLSQLGLLTAAASNNSKHHAGGGISVNKEVAIDPDEKCCYQLNQLQVATSLCNEMGCSGGCPMSIEDEQLRRAQRNQTDESINLPARPTIGAEQQLERDYAERPRPPPDEHDQRDDTDMATYERHMRRASSGGGNGGGERIREYFRPEPYENANITSAKSKAQFSERIGGETHSQNFLAIKQEPADWTTSTSATDIAQTELSSRSKTPLHSPKHPLDFKMPMGGAAVKLELGTHSHSPSSENEFISHDSGEYDAQLACETCKQSFDEPKSWVRHLETHSVNAAMDAACGRKNEDTGSTVATGVTNGGDALIKAYVPKKRRRVSQQENNAGHVTLCCDLCSISFETPAEWVRHLNNEHTEIELALFNSKKDNEQKSNHQHHQQAHLKRFTHRPTYDQPVSEVQTTAATSAPASTSTFAERNDICGKKFTTHSHLLAHKRSHSAVNGVSISTSVATSSLSTAADISVINSATNDQLSASPQA